MLVLSSTFQSRSFAFCSSRFDVPTQIVCLRNSASSLSVRFRSLGIILTSFLEGFYDFTFESLLKGSKTIFKVLNLDALKTDRGVWLVLNFERVWFRKSFVFDDWFCIAFCFLQHFFYARFHERCVHSRRLVPMSFKSGKPIFNTHRSHKMLLGIQKSSFCFILESFMPVKNFFFQSDQRRRLFHLSSKAV